MGKGPGLFSDIGKKAKDLLTKEYTYDQKFTVTTTSPNGLAFITSGTKKGDLFAGDLKSEYKSGNVRTEVKVDTASKLWVTVVAENLTNGLTAGFSGALPDNKSGKADFTFVHEYIGLTGSIGLTANPKVEVTAAVGHDGKSVGGEITYDTASGTFTRYNAGVGFTNADFSVAAHVVDKGDTYKTSVYHAVNPRTCVGVEIAHAKKAGQGRENTFTAGLAHRLDSLTTVKGKLNNLGMVAGLVQHEWRPKSTVTISGEVDTKALDKSAKIGLGLALKP
ncbi:hypothetical protein CBR_g27895 [Chara braunii]|uniref:Uncharacterized protein n=1 Tax=Chara braunii TaxID=69332 RepID=A0A388L8V1_CHABU|nr:hypothetical protein CBR_g27895 [Chara braunii]|eukprot:GBG78672.1 hypothetical protein CBR_g27895 [Chara braunii]